jgi:hypothetical protein
LQKMSEESESKVLNCYGQIWNMNSIVAIPKWILNLVTRSRTYNFMDSPARQMC